MATEAGGDFRGGLLEGVAAIVERERFEDFTHGIGFVAKRARTGSECASARATAPECYSLQFLLAKSFSYDAPAVAMRAPLWIFDAGRIGARQARLAGW